MKNKTYYYCNLDLISNMKKEIERIKKRYYNSERGSTEEWISKSLLEQHVNYFNHYIRVGQN